VITVSNSREITGGYAAADGSEGRRETLKSKGKRVAIERMRLQHAASAVGRDRTGATGFTNIVTQSGQSEVSRIILRIHKKLRS
jgi:hypothetical protein